MTGYNKETAPNYRPSRQGLKTIVFYVRPEVSEELRILAIREKKSLQQLCSDAMDEILHSRGITVPPAKKEQKEAVGS